MSKFSIKSLNFWFLGPTKTTDIDPRLVVPWVDRLCCYLPARVRRIFYFGIDHGSVQLTEEGLYPDVIAKVYI